MISRRTILGLFAGGAAASVAGLPETAKANEWTGLQVYNPDGRVGWIMVERSKTEYALSDGPDTRYWYSGFEPLEIERDDTLLAADFNWSRKTIG